VNSLNDVEARNTALSEETRAIARRVKNRGYPFQEEIDRIRAIDAEVAALEQRTAEFKSDAKRRRELDEIVKGVDEVQDYTTKGRRRLGPDIGWDEDQLKSLHRAVVERRPLSVGAKLVTTTTTPQALVPSHRLTDFPMLRDATRLLDHLPVEQTTNTQVKYYRALAAASGATAVAEGATKPESTPTWETVTADVRKLAHYAKVNNEVIDDFADFMDVVGREMLAGLIDQENAQLINGNGTPPNLLGLLGQSGVQEQARSTDTNIDCLFKGMNLLRTATFSEPTFVAIHPTNWATVRLSKNGQGDYLAQDVLSGDPARLWGYPVVVTSRVSVGTALVMNGPLGAKVYMREAPVLSVGTEGTDFIANKTTIVAEERLALTAPRPAAIVKCTGLN
jgi:HK97 family phage major capsid protein